MLSPASQAKSPSFALPHTVCTTRCTSQLSIQTRSTTRARMLASTARCSFLNRRSADRTNTLVMRLRFSPNGGFEGGVTNASRRFLLAIRLLFVFVRDQHEQCSLWNTTSKLRKDARTHDPRAALPAATGRRACQVQCRRCANRLQGWRC